MSKELRKYLLVQAVAAFVINALLNALIAYFLNRGNDLHTRTMAQNYLNYAFDILITSPLIGLFNAGSAISNLRKAGTLGSLPAGQRLARLAMGFRRPYWMGIFMGLGAAPVFWAVSVGVFALSDIVRVTLWGYTAYKALFTGLMGGLYTAAALAVGLHGTGADEPAEMDRQTG